MPKSLTIFDKKGFPSSLETKKVLSPLLSRFPRGSRTQERKKGSTAATKVQGALKSEKGKKEGANFFINQTRHSSLNNKEEDVCQGTSLLFGRSPLREEAFVLP